MTKDTHRDYHASYPVPGRATTDLHADFWVNPPIKTLYSFETR